MTDFLTRAFAIALVLGISTVVHAGITQPPPARVLVYGTHEGSNIVYHYKVINNSDVAVTNFVIGSIFDSSLGYEIPQLERLPLGWDYDAESESGTAINLAPTSTSQPPYWTSRLYGQQEAGNYYLEWRVIPDGSAYAIPPGQSLAGFSVTVPMDDARLSPHEYYNAGQVVDPTASSIDPDDDKSCAAVSR